MEPTFLELAQAARETHAIGLQTMARLAGIAPADELEAMRQRKALLLGAAHLLTEMAPSETLIRSVVKFGALTQLPEYSPVTALAEGMTVLVRARVFAEPLPSDCELQFRGVNQTPRCWVARSQIPFVERVAPTLWR